MRTNLDCFPCFLRQALEAVRMVTQNEGIQRKALNSVFPDGFDAPGTLLDRCSEEFLKHYKSSDLILSKGQGNYESLSGENRPIFFLLNVKCPVIAEDIHCDVGELVLKAQSNHALFHH